MKLLLYAMLVVFLVPLQATLLPHLAIWDVRPDLGLVVAALIGVTGLEDDGLALRRPLDVERACDREVLADVTEGVLP